MNTGRPQTSFRVVIFLTPLAEPLQLKGSMGQSELFLQVQERERENEKNEKKNKRKRAPT